MLRNFERPDWGPLIELAPENFDEFMWMFEVEMEDGLRIHAYKHSETRRYVHLDQFGRAYVYLWDEKLTAEDDGRYQEVGPSWLLDLALDNGRAAIFDHRNVLSDYEKVKWARSASRHRVPRRGATHVMSGCRLRFIEPPPDGAQAGASERFVFVGDDERGRALEVMAVEPEEGDTLLVIHAMELRDRYRLDYEEARRWPR
jgi:hypothetical protein